MPTSQPVRIDLGLIQYTHPSTGAETHWSKDGLLQRGIPEKEIAVLDTRPMVRDVAKTLSCHLHGDPELADANLDWVGESYHFQDAKWPENGDIVVAAERGSSEGYFVEVYWMVVDPTTRVKTARRLISVKTFNRDTIWNVAKKTAVLLNAI